MVLRYQQIGNCLEKLGVILSLPLNLTRNLKKDRHGALCSVMGMDCVKVMNSLTTLTASDKKDREKIISALSDHFMSQNVSCLKE